MARSSLLPMHLYGKNVQNFKPHLLWSLWANVAQISFGASLGQGNERLLKCRVLGVREMSEKFKFFQGQGIVREFCDVSVKNEILQKCQGILHFSLMKLGLLVPMDLFC